MKPQRRKALQNINKEELISIESNEDTYISEQINYERVNLIEEMLLFDDSKYDIREFNDEIKLIVKEFKENFHKNQLEMLLYSSKDQVLTSLVKPFGLGGVLFRDKLGGKVTTIHNAKQDIYANDSDSYDRKKYTRSKNSHGNRFEGNSKKSVGSEFTRSKMDNNGYVVDAYTKKIEKASNTSPDHAYSLSEYHKNGGFMQSNTKKADFATDHDNLNLTKRSINQSMRDYDKKEWAEAKQADRNVSNSEYFEINEEALNELYKKGQETAKKHLPSNIEKTKYYTKNIALTGINEGVKMGLQQALGLVILETVNALYTEIVDIFNNGLKANNESFFKELRIRCDRVVSRVINKRKEIVVAFGEGALPAFISNMITTLINMLYTTCAKTVRAIREGFYSIFKALKIIIDPPQGLTRNEAYHEASKLIATGAILTTGILIEEAIKNAIIATPVIGAFLKPFADVLTGVLIGIITGVSSALVVYLIDKIDLFNVNKNNIYNQLSSLLEGMIDDSIREIKDTYAHLTTVEI